MLPTYPLEAGMGPQAGQPLLGPRANLPCSHLGLAHLLPRPASLQGGDLLGGWPRPLCQPEPRAGLKGTFLTVAVTAAADSIQSVVLLLSVFCCLSVSL